MRCPARLGDMGNARRCRVRVSVCVPTYCRPGGLAAALEHLTALDPPDGGYEVVVVDNGSPPDQQVPAVIERAAASSETPVRWASIEVNDGPAPARNLAWRMATGECIAFTDDDCIAEPGWLNAVTAPFADERVGLVQGRTRPAVPAGPTDRTPAGGEFGDDLPRRLGGLALLLGRDRRPIGEKQGQGDRQQQQEAVRLHEVLGGVVRNP